MALRLIRSLSPLTLSLLILPLPNHTQVLGRSTHSSPKPITSSDPNNHLYTDDQHATKSSSQFVFATMIISLHCTGSDGDPTEGITKSIRPRKHRQKKYHLKTCESNIVNLSFSILTPTHIPILFWVCHLYLHI